MYTLPAQPILAWSASWRRGFRIRNFYKRIRGNFDKGYEALKEAGEVAARAASVGEGGISSDDPEAIAKLHEQLEPLRQKQARMVLANKLVRKQDREGLRAAGFPDVIIDEMVQAVVESGKCRAYEPYCSSATTQRREHFAGRNRPGLESSVSGPLSESTLPLRAGSQRHAGSSRTVEADRLQLFFPGKPDAPKSARSSRAMVSAGRRWKALGNAAGNNAIWAANYVLGVAFGDLKREFQCSKCSESQGNGKHLKDAGVAAIAMRRVGLKTGPYRTMIRPMDVIVASSRAMATS